MGSKNQFSNPASLANDSRARDGFHPIRMRVSREVA